MDKTRRVVVVHDNLVVGILGLTLLVIGLWAAGGGFRDHCREYPSATICTAYYGPSGPHAPPSAQRRDAD